LLVFWRVFGDPPDQCELFVFHAGSFGGMDFEPDDEVPRRNDDSMLFPSRESYPFLQLLPGVLLTDVAAHSLVSLFCACGGVDPPDIADLPE
jgi:hypothetical protein